MSKEYRKELKIEKDDGTQTVIMGARLIKHDLENNISGFARPDKDGGNAIYKAFNINQIKESFEITAIMSDTIANNLMNDGAINNKEDAKDRLITVFKSTDLLRLVITDKVRSLETTNETGFMEGLSFEERADKESADYKISVDFLRSEKQGS